MNKPKLVSIVIPCHQSEATITQTLKDIFEQTYVLVEIIAVNDGSTDGTLEILNRYEDKIKIINQINKGASAARNAGFLVSSGKFILFCDSDVRLKKHMIQSMVEVLEANPDKSYCYSNFKFGIHTFDLFPFDSERLKKENYISTMSLIRREHFMGFDESLNRFQDWDLWKRMLEKGYEGIWHNERLFSAPISGKGISGYNLGDLLRIIKRKILG